MFLYDFCKNLVDTKRLGLLNLEVSGVTYFLAYLFNIKFIDFQYQKNGIVTAATTGIMLKHDEQSKALRRQNNGSYISNTTSSCSNQTSVKESMTTVYIRFPSDH